MYLKNGWLNIYIVIYLARRECSINLRFCFGVYKEMKVFLRSVLFSLDKYWKPGVVSTATSSSLVAPPVVVVTTSGAIIDDTIGIRIPPDFHMMTSSNGNIFRVAGLWVTGGFPLQRAINAENVFIWWRRHERWCTGIFKWVAYQNTKQQHIAILKSLTFGNDDSHFKKNIILTIFYDRLCRHYH